MSPNESSPLNTTVPGQPSPRKRRPNSMKAECACSITAKDPHPTDHTEIQIPPMGPPPDLASKELQFKHLGSQFYDNDGGGF
ncbi:hypothetical protein IAQ61_007327 [Plenodomus lingam]|nr:hypothetical protein IAQ61_007327 [Plenodomus lingam]